MGQYILESTIEFSPVDADRRCDIEIYRHDETEQLCFHLFGSKIFHYCIFDKWFGTSGHSSKFIRLKSKLSQSLQSNDNNPVRDSTARFCDADDLRCPWQRDCLAGGRFSKRGDIFSDMECH